MGDELRVSGRLDGQGVLHAEACAVLSRWADRRAGERQAFLDAQDEQSRCWWAHSSAARHKRSGRAATRPGPPAPPDAPDEGASPDQAQQQQQQAGSVQQQQQQHCKFWVNTGKCARGDLCPFYHAPPEEDRHAITHGWIGDRCVLAV